MARIRPDWTPGTAIPNTDDFTLAFRVSASDVVNALGGLYYWPGTTAPTLLTAKLYIEDTMELVASGTLASGFEVGWNSVNYTSAYALIPSTMYRAAVETDGNYSYDDNQLATAITDPDLGLVTIPDTDGGAYGFGHVFPDNLWGGLHGSDLEFELPSIEEVEPVTTMLTSRVPSLGGFLLIRD